MFQESVRVVERVKRKVVKVGDSDLALLQCVLLQARGSLVERKTRVPELTSAGRYSGDSVDVG
jgi:hypothetical protein